MSNPTSTSSMGKVLYDFDAQAPNQISLRIGQNIKIVHYGGSGGWSKGEESGTGRLNSFFHFLNVLNYYSSREKWILSK